MQTDLSVPVEHFKKRAKDLLGQVRAQESEAIIRVRRVYNDLSGKADVDVASDFGLMRAQHVVAVEHCFASWEALCTSPGVEARLAITMAKIPELNDFGIGLFHDHRRQPLAEQQAIYEKDREVLRKSASTVEATVRWLLENVEPTKNVNPRRTSYGLKHVAEKDIGYITNGVFIAAGIIAGYPYELMPNHPNVQFAVSEKSLREIEARRRQPDRALRAFVPSARAILSRRGIQLQAEGRSRPANELVWLEDGDIRTLKIAAAETTPFVVRISIDHFQIHVSQKAVRQLGIADRCARFFPEARPVRPKAELSVMPDEVTAALEWALAHDARGDAAPAAPPFEKAVRSPPSSDDAWAYVWSKRAWDAYRRVDYRSRSDSGTDAAQPTP
ncbi:MAG: hypothetical protein HY903_10325 [Deltaproteobacteria bacterium]|nr:hypothetical protein [Deltaproteobacteria bacterium]